MSNTNPARSFLIFAALFVLLVVSFTFWTINAPATPTAVAQAATATPLSLTSLQERWETMKTHTQHGMLTLDQRIEQMGQLITDAETLLASTQETATRQVIAAMTAEMMDAARQMTAEIEKMPAARQGQRGPVVSAMMGRMESVVNAQPALPLAMPEPTKAAPAGHDMANMAPGSVEDDSMEGMGHDMSPIPSDNVPDATESVGGQLLDFSEEDGVKVFELTARPVRWAILEGSKPVTVTAWSYNGTVPGPMIRVTEGDQVRIVLTNELPDPTSIHWHGIPLPNAMDGVPPFTQMAVQPGESFTYEFTAPPAGTFMYHSHVETDKQIMIGLYAPFVVDPLEPSAADAASDAVAVDAPDIDVIWMLSEWRVGPDGETYPAMPMAGGEPNYFTINGKAFPDTEPIVAQKGDRVRIRLAGIGQFLHPMHLHGMNFRIVAYDGVPLPPEQQIVRNTVPLAPGEIVDIEFIAENPGTWVFHCHILHHVTNDGAEPGGLIGVVQVVE